jgi:quinol monooxygenase YgiN
LIHVIATIDIQEGTRDAYLAEFRKLMPLVHAEAGCLEYQPLVDHSPGLDARTVPRKDVVTILEKWESLEALQAHLSTHHMAEYRLRVKDYVTRVRLTLLSPA